jgi:hypothetical protein
MNLQAVSSVKIEERTANDDLAIERAISLFK